MSIINRLYSDFLLPSRMGEYENLLRFAISQGYVHLTIRDYFSKLRNGELDTEAYYFLHRHDIDTDTSTAAMFFKAEESLGVKSSFYFRLSTLDIPLFRQLYDHGFEVGYHYEELSDFCKLKKIRDARLLPGFYPEIRERFTINLKRIEAITGRKIKSIAAHGDFVNRKLKIPNYSFITEELMNDLGIELECYNETLIRSFGFIGSDTHFPEFYKPYPAMEAIKNKVRVIYFLSHPRHWRCNIRSNMQDNLRRLKEGLAYSNN